MKSTATRRIVTVVSVLGAATAAASCTTSNSSPNAVRTAVRSGADSHAAAGNDWTDAVDPTAIPLGDGHVASSPRIGYVDSCTLAFRPGGASHAGPWLDSTHATWNDEAKVTVAGNQLWSTASMMVAVNGATRVITTNGLPQHEPTGTFPIARSDPAYGYDHNPNTITAQSVTYRVPARPTAAPTPSCTGLGPIGVTVDGVLLYNALDDGGRDAGAHEVQDRCEGHPDGHGRYHYHSISACLDATAPGTSTLVGYALDGYGIYAERNAQGDLPTNADLDVCHGRTSTVTWDGAAVTMYHYDVTLEYPYTVGCFHGTPVNRPGQ